MPNISILDSCYLNTHPLQISDILARPSKFEQADLEECLSTDVPVLEQMIERSTRGTILVPQQVREEIGEYARILGTRLSQSARDTYHGGHDLDLSDALAYTERMHELHRVSKRVSPQRQLSQETLRRADLYHALLSTMSHGVQRTERTKDMVKRLRDTDRHIMSLALATAHDAPTYILTRDGGISESLRKMQTFLAQVTDGELPGYDIRTPALHKPGWRSPYAHNFALIERATPRANHIPDSNYYSRAA